MAMQNLQYSYQHWIELLNLFVGQNLGRNILQKSHHNHFAQNAEILWWAHNSWVDTGPFPAALVSQGHAPTPTTVPFWDDPSTGGSHTW